MSRTDAGAPDRGRRDAPTAAPVGSAARSPTGCSRVARAEPAGRARSCWSLRAPTISNTGFLSAARAGATCCSTPSILVLLARRPDRRHHHPQRRPVGRLGPRPDRLRRPASCSSTHPASRSLVVLVRRPRARRACSALVNGVLVARRPGARAGHHARHALHLSAASTTHWAGSEQINAADLPRGVPAARHQTVLGVPVLLAHRARRARRRRLLPAHLPRRPRALRDRLRPGRRPARRHPGQPPRARRVRRSAARSPASPASLYAARFGTVDCDRRHRLRAAGRRRGRGRRRRDLRRQRHRLGRGARRPAADHDQQRAASSASTSSGSRPSSARCILAAIALDRSSPCAWPRSCRSEGRACA